MSLAPIALFAYNRSQHVRQTIDTLAGNALAKQSELHIYSDGPRCAADEIGVSAVRSYLRTVDGFGSVTIVEQSSNKGLAASIIDGVTDLCQKAGKVIVLEDDLVVSSQFLTYMNCALDRFAGEPRVMQVSASMFPVRVPEGLPQSFFSRLSASWGWGTWRRAWSQFRPDAWELLGELEERKLQYRFDMEGSYGYTDLLQQQAAGRVDSWAVRWYASVFLAGGLCLWPARSLLNNIGFDGSGEHCGMTDAFGVEISERAVTEFPENIEEDPRGVEAIADFYRSLRRPLVWRYLERLRAWMMRSFQSTPTAC